MESYAEALSDDYEAGMAAKLGLTVYDKELSTSLMTLMYEDAADFTNTFRAMSRVSCEEEAGDVQGVPAALADMLQLDDAERSAAWAQWAQRYRYVLLLLLKVATPCDHTICSIFHCVMCCLSTACGAFSPPWVATQQPTCPQSHMQKKHTPHRAQLRAQGTPLEQRTAQQDAVNPVYIPRNHVMQRAIEAAELGDDGPVDTLLRLYTNPFAVEQGDGGLDAREPAPKQSRLGVELLSCSS